MAQGKPVRFSCAALSETLEGMKRKTLALHVQTGTNSMITGKIVGNCIKRMEENPDLDAKNALIQTIAEEANGDPAVAARLGIELSEFADLLSGGHGAQYIDLNIVHVDDGTADSPSIEEANALESQLIEILGADRVLGIASTMDDDSAAEFFEQRRSAIASGVNKMISNTW